MKHIELHKLLLVWLAIVLLLGACTAPPAVQTPPASLPEVETSLSSLPTGQPQTLDIDWFQPSDFIWSYWDVALQEDPLPGVLLTATQSGNSQPKKLIFLFTGKSTAFDRSVSVIMSSFFNKGILVDASVLYAEDDAAGLRAIQFAEDGGYDLIFSVGSKTTAFFHDYYQDGRLPVVAVLSKDPVLLGQIDSYESTSGTNIVYTSVSVPIELQMNYFEELVKGLRNIGVLYDLENTSAITAQVDPLEAYAREKGLNFYPIAVANPDNAKAELEQIIPETVQSILADDPEAKNSLFIVSGSRVIANEFPTVDALAGKVPVVSLIPDHVQAGKVSAVLSIGVSFDSNSILAYVDAYEILFNGKYPGDLPVGVITPPDITVNFAKAREINLKIPFSFFESATIVYGPDGELARQTGQQ